MAKYLPAHLNTKRIPYWLLIIFLGINLVSFKTDEKVPKKPSHQLTTQAPLLVYPIGFHSFDNDPIRFAMRADKQRVALGEEVTLTITAHYLNISPALLFITDGASAFRLKVLLPEGFAQTGGDYSDYVGAKLSASVSTATYSLRGYFTKAASPNEFRLLRGQANADVNSLFVEKAQVRVQVNEAVSNQQKAKGAREGALSFQIVSYDCNSGVLQYQFISSDGSPVNVTIPGVFGGAMSPNSVVSYTFPGDARQGRTVTGTASQNGDQISISFTTSCNLSSGQSSNPTPNQPSNPSSSGNGSLNFQIVSYDCNSGTFQYQFTSGSGSSVNVTLPGIFGGTMNSNSVATYTFPGDARQGRTVTGTANQDGNQINISFTTSCNLSSGQSSNPTSNQPTTPTSNPSSGCGTGNGLTGLYYNGSDVAQGLSAGRVDGQINFIWNDSPIPGKVNADGFSVRWLGQVEAPASGNYTFKTNNDDGTRLWINGQLLIDDWNGHGPTWQQGSIYLNAGQKYDLEMDFFDAWGGAQAQLYWEYPGQGMQLVPTCRLYAIAANGQTYRTASPSGNWCHYDDGCISYDYKCDSKQAFNLEFYECYTTTVGGGTGNNPTSGNPGGSPSSGNPGTGSGNPSTTPGTPTVTGSRVPTTAQMDGIDCDKISGWAFANTGGYADLDIYIIDETGLVSKAATIRANNQTRMDVRAAYGNNPNIPLDCGFVWAIPDAYKHGRPITIKVVPVNDTSPIGNSPLTSSGNCDKPGTSQGGTTGGPTIPILTNPNRAFYSDMEARGITFTDEEKAFINTDLSIRSEVEDYINQTGRKPTLISVPNDEGLDPISLYGGTDPYVGPDPNSCSDCPIITGPSSGTGIYGIPVRSAYPEGVWGDLLYRIDRILFVSSLFPGVGALRAPSAVFKAATFRNSLNALRARPSGLYDAHHILPQKFQAWFTSRGIENIHNPRFGVWWEMNSHRQNAWAYNARWEQFIAEHPNASINEITQFAKDIMAEFGFTIFWL